MHGRAYRRNQATHAFTLVELLVVVACIALLTAVLTPALSAARQAGQTVTCGARLQQWGLAFACYANDNRGMWPHCDGLDRGPRKLEDPHVSREDTADWFGWVDVLPPTIDLTPWREYPRNGKPDKSTFFQCPTAKISKKPGVYSYRPIRDGYFSYAMNSCLELDRNAWPPADGRGFPMPSFLDMAKIVAASRVITLFDQLLDPDLGYGGCAVCRSAGKHCGGYPRAFTARHARGQSKLGGNILYADGHVSWLATVWKPDWPADLEVPPRDDTNWFPYPSD